MVVVPNHYKIGLLVLLLISSCAKKTESNIEFRGINIDCSSAYVDAVSIDSVSFSSGRNLWILQGLIVVNGNEYDYQTIFDRNPLESDANPVKVIAPGCFQLDENDVPVFTLTVQKEKVMLSWKFDDQFLLVHSVITSEH